MKRAFLLLLLILILVLLGVIYYYYEYLPRKSKENELILYGNVDVRQVNLGFRVQGRVLSMPLEEGDAVLEGQFMGKLDTQPFEEALWQASANVNSIMASLVNAEQILKRRSELVATESVSTEDYETALSQRNVLKANLEAAKAALAQAKTNLDDTSIYAPAPGIILTRILEPGAIVTFGAPIYTLSLKTPIWVRAYVSEPDLGLITPGMPAEVYTDTESLPIFYGHIGFISPVAEFTPKNVETTNLRTSLVYRLRIIVKDPDNLLRQGMPVTVRLRK